MVGGLIIQILEFISLTMIQYQDSLESALMKMYMSFHLLKSNKHSC